MTDYSEVAVAELRRRPSKNPLINMMQHLIVDAAPSDGSSSSSRRQSLMRRLSGRRSSRSPSAHSDARPGGSRPPSALGANANADPALCEPCLALAAEIDESLDDVDGTFTRAASPNAADDFEKREYLLARLRDLEDNRWAATCPLCKLFWAVRVPSYEPGEYALLGMSSRDTSYLVDSRRMYELEHPARAKARGVGPGFLAVVSKPRGPGARSPDVNPDWFRESAMLFRTRPDAAGLSPGQIQGQDGRRGRGRCTSNSDANGRLAAPGMGSSHSSSSPSRRGGGGVVPPEDASWMRKGIWGREIGRVADLGVGREWLRFCEARHKGRCGRRPVSQPLEGFRLIDCAQSPPRVVERPLTEEYLALSYVRGNAATVMATATAMAECERWPRVIRDAVTVTKDLGFRYLWVDLLCIDDDDDNDDASPGVTNVRRRRQHIERMDDIYRGAAITIIAAAGDDATHGLPGVGKLTRPPQPRYSFTTSNVTLVSSLQDPRLLVKASAWYTRGWTYQEGVCARRRLIFTSEQMYWECGGMACPETMDLPLDFYHDAEEERMADFVRPGLFNGVSYLDGSWEQWRRRPCEMEEASTLSVFREADQHIASFTRRQLSRGEDSLDAFLGIARRMEGMGGGGGRLGFLVGIPVWHSGGIKDLATTRHLFALTTSFWHHKDGVGARRRAHLPSWTWAGWSGGVDLFSSVVIATDANYTIKGRKVLNHHYVAATQLTRNDSSSSSSSSSSMMRWTYSPEMCVLSPDNTELYSFSCPLSSGWSTGRFKIRVQDPLVLDRVKARTHPGGWMFNNNLSVDVKISGREGGTDTLSLEGQPDKSSIKEYIERHGRGEQMTILWFVEEAMIMFLVVEKVRGEQRENGEHWERIGRMRMAFGEDGKDVMKACGTLEGMLAKLPLRRLGESIVIE